MPDRLGWRYTHREGLSALRPMALSLAFFAIIGGGVLWSYERQNAARYAESARERDRINAQVEHNGRQIVELQAVATRAIDGHARILAELKVIREAVEHREPHSP